MTPANHPKDEIVTSLLKPLAKKATAVVLEVIAIALAALLNE
jgi:hypothetical protein